MQRTLFFIFTLYTLSATAQSPRIDTVAFHLDNLLLVFRGTVNGIETDFAFDTGAFASVTNSTNNAASNILVKDSKRKVQDANQQVAKIGKVTISELTVGRYRINNLNAVTADVSYLKCANLLLLGQDVIKRFNWFIDFEKKLIYVSETPFPVDAGMETWPLKYENNRPVIEYALNGTVHKKCLIDFGFTGVFELNASVKEGTELYEVKRKGNEITTRQTASMGLMGVGRPIQQNEFVIDSVFFSKTLVRHIPVAINERTDTKIGVQFFSLFCRRVILNFETNTLHLTLSGNPIVRRIPFDATVSAVNGKLAISGKNTTPGSSAASLEIDEEVKSVNGKALPEYTGECDFMLWYYGFRGDELIVEKLTGEKVTVKRSSPF